METPIIRNYGEGPEAKIQRQVIDFLTVRGWFVKVLHGNAFQQGMPDLFCCQRRYGYRFVECKQPEKYMFTAEQGVTFPALTAAGVGIWVLNAAADHEYVKLFHKPNWWTYYTPTKIRKHKGEPKKRPPAPKGPEAEIQRAVLQRLRAEGWFCKELHGDLFQYGMPDIFVCKKGEGWRFIEIKNPASYRFTAAQYESFPRLMSEGVGVWILTASSDIEIKKLHEPANWHKYL